MTCLSPLPRLVASPFLDLNNKPQNRAIGDGSINRIVRLSLNCKLRTGQDASQRSMPKSQNDNKIVLLGTAPPLSEETTLDPSPPPPPPPPPPPFIGLFKRLPKRVLSLLSNLPLAIGEMSTIAALMALGTAVDQGETPDYYFSHYSDDNPVLGFITGKWILALGFDHMFSSPVFLGMLVLLSASLMACTYTTQIPLVKVTRRWSFKQSPESIRKQEFLDSLPKASIQDLGILLYPRGMIESHYHLHATSLHMNQLDEEYDRGKRKKVKKSSQISNSNPFQIIAQQNVQEKQQQKKLKHSSGNLPFRI